MILENRVYTKGLLKGKDLNTALTLRQNSKGRKHSSATAVNRLKLVN